jgi:NADH dehydrogenase [ubiquinone] 1 alpha subcomplex assembly factor 6
MLRRYDRERFVTALFAPADRREDLFTLYGFNLEIARIRETVSEPLLGQIRLQWWREALDKAQGGGAAGHPIADGLAELLTRGSLPRAPIDRLLAARAFDLEERPPADLPELLTYVEDSAAGLTALAAQVLGGHDTATQEAARRVGRAWGLLGLMRSHAYHITARRLFLPADWLAARGLEIEEILAGAAPPPLAELAEQWAEEIAADLRAARALRRDIDKAALPALLPARLADSLLRALRRAGYDLLDRNWSAVAGRPLALLGASLLRRF